MTVKVKMLQGGTPLPTNFADDFNRVNASDPGKNWIRVLGGNDTVTLEAWGAATIVTNRLQIAGMGENNPNAVLKTAWLPVPMMNSRVFNAPKYFVQSTYISTAGTIATGISIRNNQSREAGPVTSPNGLDSYITLVNGQLGKVVNGGAYVVIGANVVGIVGGTVFRLEVENTGTSTRITCYANAVQVNQITELAAAFPIQRGWPGYFLVTVAGAPPSTGQQVWDDFSCGVF